MGRLFQSLGAVFENALTLKCFLFVCLFPRSVLRREDLVEQLRTIDDALEGSWVVVPK